MRITFLGQCGFLLEAAGVRIATDPYLSDYVDRTFYTPETPWRRNYPAPVSLLELSPDGVLISHAHGDHMDPWTIGEYLKAGGEAVFAAPAPECGLLEKLGARRIVRARADRPFSIGRALVTPIPCAHTEFHRDEAGDYRELSYFIECGGVKAFFGGDMSLYEGLAERLEAERPDILLLPVNGRDEARTSSGIIGNIDEVEAAQLAARVGAPYIPMHHELYGINGCGEHAICEAARATGARVQWMRPMETLEVPSP